MDKIIKVVEERADRIKIEVEDRLEQRR